jgi:hypothetical protein
MGFNANYAKGTIDLAKESLLKEPKTDKTSEGEKHRNCDHAIHNSKKCKMVDRVFSDQPV